MKRPRLGLGLFLAVFAAGVVAACSGGGGSIVPPAQPRPPAKEKMGWIRAKLFVPKKHRDKLRKQRQQRAAHVHGKNRPSFVPGSTTEVDFKLMAVNGVGISGASSYDFTIYTGGPSPQCTPSNGGFDCSVTAQAPAGSDEWQIAAGVCNGPTNNDGSCSYGATIVSESYASINVPVNGTANAKYTLNPIVASLGWSVQTGTQAPTYSGGGVYTCASPGPCWDPLLNGRFEAASHAVSLNAYDGEGDQIVPASGSGTVYDTPLYLKPDGTVDTITWSCSDPTLTWMTGAGPYGYNQGTPAHGRIVGINSPVANPSPATGYDYYGSPSPAVGNNGAEMNFSGQNNYSSGYYAGGGPLTCTATDAQGHSATYYAGDDQLYQTIFVANSSSVIKAYNISQGILPASALEYTISGFTGFPAGPESMAIDDGGNLYVADSAGGTVSVFPYGETSPTATLPIGSPAPQPGTPGAVLVDHDHQLLFVADQNNAQIVVYSLGASPAYVTAFSVQGASSGDFFQMIMDKRSALWVSDQNTGQVQSYVVPFAPGITPTVTLDSSGGVVAPESLAYDSANDYLYVGNAPTAAPSVPPSPNPPANNIVQFNASSGVPLRNHGASDPKAMAVDSYGNLYVANLSGTNSTNVYTSQFGNAVVGGGNQLTAASNPSQPKALAFGSSANYHFIYVAESYPSIVSHYGYSSGGAVAGDLSSVRYTSAEGVSGPSALAFFDGNIAASGAYAHPRIKHKRVSQTRRGCTKIPCRNALPRR